MCGEGGRFPKFWQEGGVVRGLGSFLSVDRRRGVEEVGSLSPRRIVYVLASINAGTLDTRLLGRLTITCGGDVRPRGTVRALSLIGRRRQSTG